ncbi:hypothetical protein GOODEAATRI_029764 [Goodea atripinnis]|uniref:Tetrahydrofolate dehydrogenase/cyclohydrolase catalytic domain-containing protein n=1 Tax=Goodea atripinnis TaxID=208336 RepID=A0ABV0Q244_9TELE
MSSALQSAMLSLASWSLRLSAAGCLASRRSIATVVSGNKTSKLVRERLKKDVEKMKSQFSGFRPSLVVLQVGDRDDSNLYISTKLKAAAEGLILYHPLSILSFPRSPYWDHCCLFCTFSLRSIFRNHNVLFHRFSDDIQAYMSVKLSSSNALTVLWNCLAEINILMRLSFLNLNEKKD